VSPTGSLFLQPETNVMRARQRCNAMTDFIIPCLRKLRLPYVQPYMRKSL
jgi:hypothetical protein